VKDVARSVKWVKENIANYKGDVDRVFISGHSGIFVREYLLRWQLEDTWQLWLPWTKNTSKHTVLRG
jgi:hypothetical protein